MSQFLAITVTSFICCQICFWFGQYRGYREGRLSAFHEIQRLHLEDEEALNNSENKK